MRACRKNTKTVNAVHYFWIGTGSFTQRFVNTLVLLLAAYVAQVFIFYLDKYESKIVKQEPKEREKP